MNLKSLIVAFFFVFIILYVTVKPNYLSLLQSSKNIPSSSQPVILPMITSTCSKIPPSLANTLIHYVTSKVTPQQTIQEISITAEVLQRKSPCNFLVFGLGHDSLMWSALNHNGRTIFLEENKDWIDKVLGELPTLEAYHINYNDTEVSQANELLALGKSAECMTTGDTRSSKCKLALKGLPEVLYEVEWDLIMVDAPTGFFPGAPGRMSAIYTAGAFARWRKEGETDVFVHDVNRVVEDVFSRTFLCDGYLKHKEGLLRHFTIPSHRISTGVPYCPAV